LKAKVFKPKYHLRLAYRSSSIWPGIKQFYDTILQHTSWTVGIGTVTNLWNDGSRILMATISQFWNGYDWIIPLPLQQVNHFFEHIMIRQEQDTPNWILEDSGHFTLKSARKFFLDAGVPCGWGKIIWSPYIPPSKTLVLWKVLISFIFRLLWLLNFMKLYMLLKKLKRWVLLVYGLNVILPWFVLHLLLRLMFIGFFVIGGTLVLITVEKSGFRFFTFFVKGCMC